ncbi:MAG: hypothetical protein JSW08_00405 [archaeon]|nr:MAG: hypothetical protein JSW08_00405 [archaeon]
MKSKNLNKRPNTILGSIKQEGVKGFLKRWVEGMKKIPPDQLLRSELIGYVGSILGHILAIFIFIFVVDSLWAIAVILGFSIVIQASQAIGKFQQYDAMKKLKAQMVKIQPIEDVIK